MVNNIKFSDEIHNLSPEELEKFADNLKTILNTVGSLPVKAIRKNLGEVGSSLQDISQSIMKASESIYRAGHIKVPNITPAISKVLEALNNVQETSSAIEDDYVVIPTNAIEQIDKEIIQISDENLMPLENKRTGIKTDIFLTIIALLFNIFSMISTGEHEDKIEQQNEIMIQQNDVTIQQNEIIINLLEEANFSNSSQSETLEELKELFLQSRYSSEQSQSVDDLPPSSLDNTNE